MNEWTTVDYSVISSNAILSDQKKVFRWEKSWKEFNSHKSFLGHQHHGYDVTRRLKYEIQINWHRLFTVPYHPVRSSRSSALRCGLPSCMSVKFNYYLKIKMAAINGRTRYISTISRKNRGLWTVYNWQHSCVWWFPWLPYLPSKTWHCFNPVCHRRIAYSVIIALWENQRKMSHIYSLSINQIFLARGNWFIVI